MWLRRAARHALALCATLLLGGLLGAALVRMAPGFGVDERELDARLSEGSVQALRQAHAGERHIVSYYVSHIAGMLRGDFGVSHSLRRPVGELIGERLPITVRTVITGLTCGWLLGLGLALAATSVGRRADLAATVAAGAFLCLPSAVVALACLYAGSRPALAIGFVVFPRVYRYSRNVLHDSAAQPHVLMARAKGAGRLRVLFRHVLTPAAPQVLAVAGVSVNLAFGAAIPIEVICDSPGIGQLAWQAALSRDLPLLVNVTMLVTFITLAANAAADLAAAARRIGPPAPLSSEA